MLSCESAVALTSAAGRGRIGSCFPLGLLRDQALHLGGIRYDGPMYTAKRSGHVDGGRARMKLEVLNPVGTGG